MSLAVLSIVLEINKDLLTITKLGLLQWEEVVSTVNVNAV